jgi:hypothetical protein
MFPTIAGVMPSSSAAAVKLPQVTVRTKDSTHFK